MKGTMKGRAQWRTATRIWWPILSQLQLHEEKPIESEDLHGDEEASREKRQEPERTTTQGKRVVLQEETFYHARLGVQSVWSPEAERTRIRQRGRMSKHRSWR